MIRLNYGCGKRVRYCALIFAADIVPSLSTIQWDLKKPACESTEASARPLKKKISCQTQKWNFWKRPSTDFDKNYIFGIGTSSAIEWYLSLLLSISWPSDEPWCHTDDSGLMSYRTSECCKNVTVAIAGLCEMKLGHTLGPVLTEQNLHRYSKRRANIKVWFLYFICITPKLTNPALLVSLQSHTNIFASGLYLLMFVTCWRPW